MPGPYKGRYNIPITKIQPWSDVLMRFEMPESMLECMRNVVDETLGNPNSENYNDMLVGQMDIERGISESSIPSECLNGLYECFDTYIQECEKQLWPLEWLNRGKNNIEITMMWVNVQRENEYIPMHMHNNCNLSAVMYLGMPEEMLPSRKDFEKSDGNIEFIGGMNTWGRNLTKSTFRTLPRVSDLYVFPSHMGHTAYPFRGKGNRISVSMNISYTKE